VSNPDLVFENLCRERGGAEHLTVVQLAAARQLAQVLAGDGVNVGTITALLNLLPPVSAPQLPTDLSRLNDSEIGLLQRLIEKSQGAAIEPISAIEFVVPPEQVERERAELASLRLENERLSARATHLELLLGRAHLANADKVSLEATK